MVSILQKNNVLFGLSEILQQHKAEIIETNRADLDSCRGIDASMTDRLKVDAAKIDAMSRSLREVAAMDDPEGKILYSHTREDGLRIENRTVPFGTILIIYESRPDVTIEAAATAFKAGNRILLKGGKESRNTNLLLTQLWKKALSQQGVDESYVEYLDFSREEMHRLITENTHRVDLIIPRGGDSLIRYVKENASVPVIVSGRGNNFLFIDRECDFEMAIPIVVNGKKRISVCNALDKVLIDKDLPGIKGRIGQLVSELRAKNIQVLGDSAASELIGEVERNTDEMVLFEEFMAPKIYLSLVNGLPEAVNLINRYSGGHSATIVTNNPAKADEFMQQVDCAAVYHNASTRFTDGGQFGVGAEIAISTQKLHFRGPLGAQELVTNKWFVYGNGQIRE